MSLKYICINRPWVASRFQSIYLRRHLGRLLDVVESASSSFACCSISCWSKSNNSYLVMSMSELDEDIGTTVESNEVTLREEWGGGCKFEVRVVWMRWRGSPLFIDQPHTFFTIVWIQNVNEPIRQRHVETDRSNDRGSNVTSDTNRSWSVPTQPIGRRRWRPRTCTARRWYRGGRYRPTGWPHVRAISSAIGTGLSINC
jgi:hypothetical protein